MNIIEPVYVVNTTQLEEQMSLNSSVICIINPNLVDPLKKEVKNDIKFFEKAKKKRKIGAWGAVGGIIGGIAIDIATGGIAGAVVAGIAVVGGGLTAGSGTLDALSGLSKSRLRNYIWQDSNDDILVLVKAKGTNAFDPMKEEIDFSGLSSAIKNASSSATNDPVNIADALFDVTYEGYHIVVTKDKYRVHMYINDKEYICSDTRGFSCTLSYTIDGNCIEVKEKENALFVIQLLFNNKVIAYKTGL